MFAFSCMGKFKIYWSSGLIGWSSMSHKLNIIYCMYDLTLHSPSSVTVSLKGTIVASYAENPKTLIILNT